MGSSAFVLLVSLCVLVLAELHYTDLPIHIPRKRTTMPPLDSVTFTMKNSCRGNRIDCGGCSSVMLCNYQNDSVGWYDCATVDAARPYCTGLGVCSSIIDPDCQTESDLCPGPLKIYPDPANCTQSLYCDEKLQATRLGSPSSSYVFNFTSQSWSLRRTNADCFQINCLATGQQNTWVSFKPDPRLSIYCGSYGAMTFECQGDNFVFNESMKQCEFSCLTAGNFPHPDDTKRYYMCLPATNGKLQLFEQTCPDGLTFNKILKNCAL